MAGAELGRMVEFEQGLRWQVLFPDDEHLAASCFLRDLARSSADRTPLSPLSSLTSAVPTARARTDE